MELEIEGIVISTTPIKEKDAMINLLTPNGRVGFFARSVMSYSNKNSSSCLLFSHSRFLLGSRGDNLSLKKGEIVNSYYKLYESIETMTALSIMSEMTMKLLHEDEGSEYDLFLKILNCLSSGFDSLTLITIYLANLIKLSGYSLNYDCCINCGSTKNIVAVSYYNGGFICSKCNENRLSKEENQYLKTFRYVFKVDINDIDKIELNRKITKRLLKDLLDYIKDKFSFRKWNGEELYFNSID